MTHSHEVHIAKILVAQFVRLKTSLLIDHQQVETLIEESEKFVGNRYHQQRKGKQINIHHLSHVSYREKEKELIKTNLNSRRTKIN